MCTNYYVISSSISVGDKEVLCDHMISLTFRETLVDEVCSECPGKSAELHYDI